MEADQAKLSTDADLKKDRVEVLALEILALIAVIACAIAVCMYALNIGGSLSSKSSDWSDFGGYIGGVLGPLISFLTLLAILITIRLQRKMLLLQEKEFDAIYRLQVDTFNSQKQQALDISNSAEDARRADRKNSLLKSIERLNSSTVRDIQKLEATRALSMASLKFLKTHQELDQAGEGISKLSSRIEELEKRKLSLESLMLEFSLDELSSIDQMQSKFHARIIDIYKP
ncbi:hypothetical protein NPS46_16860 [Pseudomonas putida]|uniref:hypothetical protein n=1 Tax=Pseudomonas putida TaxID=303 RepID=UPI002363BEAE|nr:hypothetical protein [Pseudomonas putida]MDD2054222.1 hypothetical protein [Pseudomonas putida]